jgi:NADH dehydrogenase FAD-containing subunit
VFAAGDCTTVPYKQIVIAAGAGATAALSAFDHLIRSRHLKPLRPEGGAGQAARCKAGRGLAARALSLVPTLMSPASCPPSSITTLP